MATGTIKTQAKPKTLIRPLSVSKTDDWNYTAPSDGILCVMVRSQGRKYVGCLWNGEVIGGMATDGQNDMLNFQVFCKCGDVVTIEGLDATHYAVHTATAFISFE